MMSDSFIIRSSSPSKVGHRVLFGKWSGTEVKIDALDYDTIMKGAEMHAFLHRLNQIVKRARGRKPAGRKNS